jgi:hypothetical protein
MELTSIDDHRNVTENNGGSIIEIDAVSGIPPPPSKFLEPGHPFGGRQHAKWNLVIQDQIESDSHQPWLVRWWN